jgi:hypothetical protein
VSEAFEVGARRAGRIDQEHVAAPSGIHRVLAMGGLDYDCIEVLWVLAISEIERTVVKIYSSA